MFFHSGLNGKATLSMWVRALLFSVAASEVFPLPAHLQLVSIPVLQVLPGFCPALINMTVLTLCCCQRFSLRVGSKGDDAASKQHRFAMRPRPSWRGVQARGQRTWPLSGLVFHSAVQRGSLTFSLVCSRELQTWGSDRCVQVQAETDEAWRRVAFKTLFKCIFRKIRSLFFIIYDLIAESVTTVSYMKTSSWSIYSLFYNEFICWTTWVG